MAQMGFTQKIFNHLSGATVNNLAPGDYTICITSDEEINFESCFNTILEILILLTF